MDSTYNDSSPLCCEYKENQLDSIDPERNLCSFIQKESKYYTDDILCNTLKNKKGLSIIHFNIRSLNANFKNLDMYLTQLEIKFDVVAITETWFSNNTVSSVFNIKGYDLYYVSRNEGKGGGVALYVNSSIKSKQIESMSLCVEDSFECVTVELLLEGSRNVIISCIYRKPATKLDDFTNKLEDLYSNIKNNKVIYLCGDYNINLLKQDTHVPTKHFLDTMFSLGLCPLISKPSRITSNSATLIDNIFTNELKHENISGLVLNDISDHLPVFTWYGCKVKSHNDQPTVYKRNIDSESLQSLISDLEMQAWEEVYSQEDANLCYNAFLHTFKSLLDKHCPMSVKHFKKGRKQKPWLTKGLINACKKKNAMYLTFVRSKSQTDEQKYKVYKNKLTKILKNAERSYYNEQLMKQKNNMKATWKILKEVIRGTTVSSKIPETFLEGNEEIQNKKYIANRFNDFFVNVGPNLASEIQTPVNVSVTNYLADPNAHTMYLDPVNESEVMNIVRLFDRKNSFDCHGMNMSLIKDVIVSIAKPFAHVCNLSFNTGVFPDLMKVAKVVPLFKSGKNNIFTNYRPVSLLPQFSKILEKLFNKRLDIFLNKHGVLSENQYGFRENRSTSLALIELVEHLTQSVDEHKHTIGVFIDLKKAFDTIDHKILLNKLYHYGLRGISNDWIRSYLLQRKQYVRWENYESDYMDVLCGVPQGSILGPKLFILYINDLCRVSNCLKFILFADDTNIFCSGHDIIKLSEMVTFELKKLKDWFAVNRLSLNVSKTNYMLFSNSKYSTETQIQICNTDIARVNVTKFLGVLIDDKLTWKDHIELVKSKISKSVFLLSRAKHVLNYSALLTLYNSIVLPYFTYCCELWGCTYKSRLKSLEILQKKVIRIIHAAKYREHTKPLFYESKILKLNELVDLSIAIIMFKAYNMLLPKNIQSLFRKKTHTEGQIETRHINNFHLPRARTTLKSMSITVYGVKLWNTLSQNIINESKTLHKFKENIKAMLLRRYIC